MRRSAGARRGRTKPSKGRAATRSSAKRAASGRAKRAQSPSGARKGPTLHRRRARTLLVGSALFAAVVLGTSMPLSTLLAQHDQLSSTSGQVSSLEAQNRALQEQAKQLSDSSTVDDIARVDYGLVSPGSQAYEIIPTSGASTDSVQGSSRVPLSGPPVVPGSERSLQLLGAGTGAGTQTGSSRESSSQGSVAAPTAGARGATGRSAGDAGGSSGFWTRVIHTLEFWR